MDSINNMDYDDLHDNQSYILNIIIIILEITFIIDQNIDIIIILSIFLSFF